jgi:ribosomal protein S18 acetylase RimI-like enzyme
MRVRSLGLHTDLALHGWRGRVIDRHDHLVVLHPDNPTFRMGNLLVFEQPPDEGDAERWCDLFDRAVGRPPHVLHRAFSWDGLDGEEGAIEPFLARGFTPERNEILAAPRLGPPAGVAGLELRAMTNDTDWAAVLEGQLDAFERTPEGIEFVSRLVAAYRRSVDAGRGTWWGAFLEDRLVANLGLFRVGELARYQAVVTDAAHRRRGIASTLIHHAAERARRDWGSELLLLEADPGGPAIALYRRLGFETIERRVAICEYPRDDAPPPSTSSP